MKFYVLRAFLVFVVVLCFADTGFSQRGDLKWSADGSSYLVAEDGGIVRYTLPQHTKTVLIAKNALISTGQGSPLAIRNFSYSEELGKMLIYTNARKVWRQYTRGDYWLYDIKKNELRQLGKSRPASSMMFAKISPDGSRVAYVSEHNIYVEELAGNEIKLVTSTNGTKKLINGTFDWAYEEEFDCRDGFRWSPDSKSIAYWQIDAN